MDATLVIGKQGRIVIPAEVRAELGLEAGDRLHAVVVGARLMLERPADAVEALRQLGRGVEPRRSLVDELLDERRAAAAVE
jgi:AbrB family looped-hinge helix DNA binding protein